MKGNQVAASEEATEITFCDNMPFFTIMVYFVTSMFYAVSHTIEDFAQNITNNPEQVLPPNFQIWRLFTSIFTEQSLTILILMLLSYHNFLAKIERQTSTFWIGLTYMINGFLIQVLYTGICWGIGWGTQQTAWLAYGGACSIWFNFMTKYCLTNRQNKLKLCCCNVKLDKIFYPLIMMAIVTLIDFKFKLDIIIGILLAVVQWKVCNGSIICYNFCLWSKIDSCCCRCFHPWHRCIKHTSEKLGQKRTPYDRVQIHDDGLADPSLAQSTPNDSDIFKNAKGYSLSDE